MISLAQIFATKNAPDESVIMHEMLQGGAMIVHEVTSEAAMLPFSEDSYFEARGDIDDLDPAHQALLSLPAQEQWDALRAIGTDGVQDLPRAVIAGLHFNIKEEIARYYNARIDYERNAAQGAPDSAAQDRMDEMKLLRHELSETLGFEPAFVDEIEICKERFLADVKHDQNIQDSLANWQPHESELFAASMIEKFCTVFGTDLPTLRGFYNSAEEDAANFLYQGTYRPPHSRGASGEVEIYADQKNPVSVVNAVMETMFHMVREKVRVDTTPPLGNGQSYDLQARIFQLDLFSQFYENDALTTNDLDRYVNKPTHRFVFANALEMTADITGDFVPSLLRIHNHLYIRRNFDGSLDSAVRKAYSQGELKPFLQEISQDLPLAAIARALSPNHIAELQLDHVREQLQSEGLFDLIGLRVHRGYQYFNRLSDAPEKSLPQIMGDEGNIDAKFKKMVFAADRDLPPKLGQLFSEFGISAVIARRLIDIDTGAETTEARGYEGLPLSCAPALFAPSEKRMGFFAEVQFENEGQLEYRAHGNNPYHTYMHESGHALDMILEGFSASDPDFIKAYQDNLGALDLSAGVSENLRYYVTKEHGGRQETAEAARSEMFAEVFAEIFSGKRDYLSGLFPDCAAIISTLVSSIERELEAFPTMNRRHVVLDFLAETLGQDPPDDEVIISAALDAPQEILKL